MAGLTTANARLARVRTLPARYVREVAEIMDARRRELGVRIKQAREEKRWKQKQLAAAVGVEPMTVSRWERGQHTPDLDMLDRVAAVLGRPIAYFIPAPPEEHDRLLQIHEQLDQLLEAVSLAADRAPAPIDAIELTIRRLAEAASSRGLQPEEARLAVQYADELERTAQVALELAARARGLRARTAGR